MTICHNGLVEITKIDDKDKIFTCPTCGNVFKYQKGILKQVNKFEEILKEINKEE